MPMMGPSMMNGAATTPTPIVVVTISAIADVTSGTTAKTPTVSATINRGDGLGAVAATITAWAWEQDDATTNITGPTTATPSIAIVAGRHVVTVSVTIDGVVYLSSPEVYTVGPTALSATIDVINDQSTLTPVAFDVDVTGGVTPYAYAWTVNGADTDITGATTEGPTYTPPAAQGRKAVACTITDAVGQTCQATPRSFVVGPTPLGATIGGSTAAHAALTAQNDATALSLAATSVTGIGTVSWVWTVAGPSGDETAQIITAGSTTASPTWAAFTAATGKTCGGWVIKAVGTDEALQTMTFTRTVQVGALVGNLHYRLAGTVDFTTLAAADWTGSDGNHTVGSYTVVSRNGANAGSFGPLLNSALQITQDLGPAFIAGTRTAPIVDMALVDLIPGWAYGVPFCVQAQYAWQTAPAANDCNCRLLLCSETPTTISGEYMVSVNDGFASGAANQVTNQTVDATGSNYTNTPLGPSYGLELLSDGTGITYGRVGSDTAGAVVTPGTWTRLAVSASADTGPRPWVTALPNTAPETAANARVGMATSRTAAGTDIDLRIHKWRGWISD